MKIKLLKRLRRQAARNLGYPYDLLDSCLHQNDVKFARWLIFNYRNDIHNYMFLRIAKLRRRRARNTLVMWTGLCFIVCTLNTAVFFGCGNWPAGMGWLCAAMAWFAVYHDELMQ